MKKFKAYFLAFLIMCTGYNLIDADNIDFELPDVSFETDKIFEDLSLKTGATSIDNYVSLCDGVIADYNYDELYFSDEEIYGISKAVLRDNEKCNNSELDKDALLCTIKSNTELYLSNNPELYNIFDLGYMFEEIDPYILSELVSNTIWKSIIDDSSNKEENYCNMKNIKIVVDNSMMDATGKYIDNVSYNSIYFDVDDKKTIIINMDLLIKEYHAYYNLYVDNPEYYEDPGSVYDYFTKVLEHELNHVKQYCCDCRRDAGQITSSIEVGFDSSNEIVVLGNSLIEASAESDLYSDNVDNVNNLSYVYEDYRKTEALFLLTSIFNSNVDEYYNAIKNTDFESFYKFFGLDSKEDFYNFYKALYSVEAIHGENNFIVGQDREIVGDAYNVDLYKLFLKNLFQYSSDNSNFSFEDSIFLNEFAKTILLSNSCSYYDAEGDTYYKWDMELGKDFVQLDEIYNAFVFEHYGKSLDEISLERDTQQEAINNIINGNYNDYSSYEILNRYPIIKNILLPSGYVSYDVVDAFDERFQDEREDAKVFIKNY